MAITIKAHRSTQGGPFAFPWKEEAPVLRCGERRIFTQKDGDGLAVILPPMAAGEELRCEAGPAAPAPSLVKTVRRGDAAEVFIGDLFFTVYNTDGVRPFLHPVLGPGNVSFLRRPLDPGEKGDHPHHRGIWAAHGLVNGADNWSEESGHGRTVHREFAELVSGPVFGRIRATGDWVDRDAKTLLAEERTITVYNLPPEGRILDQELTLKAVGEDVVFGDTKESGIIALRVAAPMTGGKGVITNADGGVGEKACWGKRSAWCDYSGAVEGVPLGVSIFDRPDGFRFPVWWHVRDYGLFAAGYFGLSDFTGDKSRDGSHRLAAGDELKFRHRVFIHAGTAKEARVAERYADFAEPPVSLKTG